MPEMKIIISEFASNQYKEIREYLVIEVGESTAKRFDQKFYKLEELISENSLIGVSEVPNLDIRSVNFTSKLRVFYKIEYDQIIVLQIYDVRQNPKNRPY